MVRVRRLRGVVLLVAVTLLILSLSAHDGHQNPRTIGEILYTEESPVKSGADDRRVINKENELIANKEGKLLQPDDAALTPQKKGIDERRGDDLWACEVEAVTHSSINVSEVEEVMERRRYMLEEKCGDEEKSVTLNSKEFMISDKYKLVWCNIFKSASSSWLHHFLLMAGMTPHQISIMRNGSPVEAARQYYPRPSVEELTRYLADSTYTSFIIVRDPFERLLSAYRDKIGPGSQNYFRSLRCQIANYYRPEAKKRPSQIKPTRNANAKQNMERKRRYVEEERDTLAKLKGNNIMELPFAGKDEYNENHNLLEVISFRKERMAMENRISKENYIGRRSLNNGEKERRTKITENGIEITKPKQKSIGGKPLAMELKEEDIENITAGTNHKDTSERMSMETKNEARYIARKPLSIDYEQNSVERKPLNIKDKVSNATDRSTRANTTQTTNTKPRKFNIQKPKLREKLQTMDCQPTFQQFVEFVVDEERKGNSHNEHWQPMYLFCSPCQGKFDYILHFETLLRDEAFLVAKVPGLETIVTQRLHSSHTDYSQITAEYFPQLPRSLLVDLYQVYQNDFEIFGYSVEKYFDYLTLESQGS